MKTAGILIIIVLTATLASSAASADVACFDWICDTSGSGCDFDASCSEGTPTIWKFYWAWGDGTNSGLDPDPLQSHVYPGNVFKPTVTLQVWTFYEVTTVSCRITNREAFGHPLPYFSGRCTSE